MVQDVHLGLIFSNVAALAASAIVHCQLSIVHCQFLRFCSCLNRKGIKWQ
jgi:hypothetical protein